MAVNISTVVKTLTMMAGILGFPKATDDDAVLTWKFLLDGESVSDKEFLSAVRRWIKDEESFPVPAQILKSIKAQREVNQGNAFHLAISAPHMSRHREKFYTEGIEETLTDEQMAEDTVWKVARWEEQYPGEPNPFDITPERS